jgi:hypothetical protein
MIVLFMRGSLDKQVSKDVYAAHRIVSNALLHHLDVLWVEYVSDIFPGAMLSDASISVHAS